MQLPLPQLLPAVLRRLHRQAEQVAQILHLADGAAPLQLADHHRGRQQTGGKGVGFRLLCGAVALVAQQMCPSSWAIDQRRRDSESTPRLYRIKCLPR